MNAQESFSPIPTPPPLITRLGWPDRLLIIGFCVIQLLLAAALLLIGYHVLAGRSASRAPLRDEATLPRNNPQPNPAAESQPQVRSSLPPELDASSPFSAADADSDVLDAAPESAPADVPAPPPPAPEPAPAAALTASSAPDADVPARADPIPDSFSSPFADPFSDPFADPFFSPFVRPPAAFRAPPAFFAPDPVAELARATLQDMRTLFDADPAWLDSPTRPAMGMTTHPDRYEIALDRIDPDSLDVSLDGRTLSVAYRQSASTSTSASAQSMNARFLLPGPVADHDALRITPDPDARRVFITVFKPNAPALAATAP